MDAYLYLRNSYGYYITYDNNSGSGDDPRITYTATSTGTYFLDVGDVGSNNTGSYEIKAKTLAKPDDFRADRYTSGRLAIGGKTSGNLNFNGDRDWFKVSLVKGQKYQFDVIEYNAMDAYLYLRNSYGSYITYDNNSGSGDDPRITYLSLIHI